jgi:hypothetical protein
MEDMNCALLKPFCIEEVQIVLHHMAIKAKSSSPRWFYNSFFLEELGNCGEGYLLGYNWYSQLQYYASISEFDKYCTYPEK